MGESAGLAMEEKAGEDESVVRAAVQVAAILKAAEALAPKKAEPRLAKFMNSGLGLLIAGTVLSSLLVPVIQRASEERKAQRETAQKLLAAFLEYSNTPWEEYHVALPLRINPRQLTAARYDEILKSILAVKLRRYNALASLEALAIRLDGENRGSNLRPLLHDYAVKVNRISDTMARSIGAIYCATGGCNEQDHGGSSTPLSDIGNMINDLDGDETKIVSTLATVTR